MNDYGFAPPANAGIGIRPDAGVGFKLGTDSQFVDPRSLEQQIMQLKTLLMLLERQRMQNPYSLATGMQPMRQMKSGMLGNIR
jgi:hypothetical protein